MAEGVIAEFCNVQLFADGRFIQCFHIFKADVEFQAAGIDTPVDEGVEYERVIRAWGKSEA